VNIFVDLTLKTVFIAYNIFNNLQNNHLKNTFDTEHK
jgi:hypothetical protein